jgi:hypothetical protein
VGWSLLLLKGYDTLTTSKNAHAKAWAIYLTSPVVVKGRSFQQPRELKQTRLNFFMCSQKY